MLIRVGYDIVLQLFNASSVIFRLRVHPFSRSLLLAPEDLAIEPDLPLQYYRDSFGNHCGRLNAPAGRIRFRNHAVVRDSGEPDVFAPEAEEEVAQPWKASGRESGSVEMFANHQLEKFTVVTEEIQMNGKFHAEVERAVHPAPPLAPKFNLVRYPK